MRKILLIALFACLFSSQRLVQAAILPIGSGEVSIISSQAENNRKFPEILARNLEGEAINIPHELEAKNRLLILAFARKQQEDVNTWLTATETLVQENKDFAVYELPTIKEMNSMMRFYINNGMRYGIPSKKQREKTITLYIDKSTLKQRLGIKTEEQVYAFLVNAQGDIVWQAQGLANQTHISEINKLINKAGY